MQQRRYRCTSASVFLKARGSREGQIYSTASLFTPAGVNDARVCCESGGVETLSACEENTEAAFPPLAA